MLEFAGLDINILTVLVFLPLLGAIVVTFVPKNTPNVARAIALGTSLIVLGISIYVFLETWEKDLASGEYAFQGKTAWFDLLGASWARWRGWYFCADGFADGHFNPIALLIAFEHTERPHAILALFLFMETGMLGVFVALDMLIFFLFYEIGLVPMYFHYLPVGWRQPRLCSA